MEAKPAPPPVELEEGELEEGEVPMPKGRMEGSRGMGYEERNQERMRGNRDDMREHEWQQGGRDRGRSWGEGRPMMEGDGGWYGEDPGWYDEAGAQEAMMMQAMMMQMYAQAQAGGVLY